MRFCSVIFVGSDDRSAAGVTQPPENVPLTVDSAKPRESVDYSGI